jgi:hypothetical protein
VKNVPLGVYDHPSSPDDAPQVKSVHLDDESLSGVGNDVIKGAYYFTRARDFLGGLTEALMP